MDLIDKTVIVTGASSGIGAAAAALFAREGAHVVLDARRAARIDDLAARIRATGGSAVALARDVRDEAYADALVRLAETSFGGLDAAFNNAGTMGAMSPLPEMAAETWHDVIATNLTSAFFAAKYQIPAMVTRGGGAIVFTASFVGHVSAGLPGMSG